LPYAEYGAAGLTEQQRLRWNRLRKEYFQKLKEYQGGLLQEPPRIPRQEDVKQELQSYEEIPKSILGQVSRLFSPEARQAYETTQQELTQQGVSPSAARARGTVEAWEAAPLEGPVMPYGSAVTVARTRFGDWLRTSDEAAEIRKGMTAKQRVDWLNEVMKSPEVQQMIESGEISPVRWPVKGALEFMADPIIAPILLKTSLKILGKAGMAIIQRTPSAARWLGKGAADVALEGRGGIKTLKFGEEAIPPVGKGGVDVDAALRLFEDRQIVAQGKEAFIKSRMAEYKSNADAIGFRFDAKGQRAILSREFDEVAARVAKVPTTPPVGKGGVPITDLTLESWTSLEARKASDEILQAQREYSAPFLKQRSVKGEQQRRISEVVEAEIARRKAIPTTPPVGKVPVTPKVAEAGVVPPKVTEGVPPVKPAVRPPVKPPAMGAGGTVPPKVAGASDDDIIRQFGEFLVKPEGEEAWNLTVAMRSKALGRRTEVLRTRAEELMAGGSNAENAIRQAMEESLTGKLPRVSSTFVDEMADELRQALFSKVYRVLEREPLEMVSTVEALTNALLGKPIPRIAGIKGGSAYSRLLRVFGDNPEIIQTLQQGKPLRDVIERQVLGSKRLAGEIQAMDEEMAAYLRNIVAKPYGQARLGEGAYVPGEAAVRKTPRQMEFELDQLKIDLAEASKGTAGGKLTVDAGRALTPEDALLKGARQAELIARDKVNIIRRALGEAGMTIRDIGLLLRANLASFDISFWRQQKYLILGSKKHFAEANVKAIRVLKDSNVAKQEYYAIQQHPRYSLYQKLAEEKGYDFLRPREIPGGKQWMGVEEFGAYGIDRPIPRLTQRLPWVKKSQEMFVTAANDHNWKIWNKFFDDAIKFNERIASGAAKAPKGWSVESEMIKFSQYLSEMTGRGNLGKARNLASNLGGIFFAPRLNVGRMMAPRHLLSANRMVRKRAWKDFTLTVGTVSSILIMGEKMNLWEVEWDPRSSDFAKIRIGGLRIDPWGGYQQFVVFAARLKALTGISSVTGAEYKADPLQTTVNLARTKAAPLTGMIADFWTGRTFKGEEADVTSGQQWLDRGLPMALQDIVEAIEEHGIAGAAVAPLAVVGEGILAYPEMGKNAREFYSLPDIRGMHINLPDSDSIDGVPLDDDETKLFRNKVAQLSIVNIKKLQASPLYKRLSDEEKKEHIKDIMDDARKRAKEWIGITIGEANLGRRKLSGGE